MNFDCGGTGRRSRVKDWHVPRPVLGVFGASSPPRWPPNILCRRLGTCGPGVDSHVAPAGRDSRTCFDHAPAKPETCRPHDTPRRVASFRKPGCLEPFLGHDDGGDCSPEDHSSLGLRLTGSDRPLGDAALLRGPCRRRGQCSTISYEKELSGRRSHGREER